MTVRWGALSTAPITAAVLEGARASDRVEFIAVASREGARAQAYAREHGIERAYGGYNALLEDPDVEAVYVSLWWGLVAGSCRWMSSGWLQIEQ